MLYLALAAASFGYVFLKAFQQKSVAGDNYIAIIPVSLGLAAMEVFTVAKIAETGWHILTVLAIGLSAGTGAIVAMLVHNRIFKKGRHDQHSDPRSPHPGPCPDL